MTNKLLTRAEVTDAIKRHESFLALLRDHNRLIPSGSYLAESIHETVIEQSNTILQAVELLDLARCNCCYELSTGENCEWCSARAAFLRTFNGEKGEWAYERS